VVGYGLVLDDRGSTGCEVKKEELCLPFSPWREPRLEFSV
jgi:hypothetical protein